MTLLVAPSALMLCWPTAVETVTVVLKIPAALAVTAPSTGTWLLGQ